MRRKGRRRGKLGQLLKGLIIGLVLLLAIITTTNLLNKGKNKYVGAPESTTIPAPSISLTQQKNTTTNDVNSSETMGENTTISANKKEQESTYKPALEGEQTTEEIAEKIKAEQEKQVAYGFLKATAINPKSKQALKVNFAIFNDKNIKVIEGDSTNNPSFKLPIGRYRVVATLLNGENKQTNAESSETILIREDEITRKTFNVTPPVSIGVLQVSAINANNKQSLRANFTIQKENGEIVATRNNVSNTLFKLESGSYKVTVTSGKNSDSRTIDIDAGGSTKETFKLQEASKQGKLLVRALEGRSDAKVAVNITITNESDEVLQKLTDVNQTEITLPVGNYTIHVATSYAHANKNIHVAAGKVLNEIFRFEPPEPKKGTTEQAIANKETSTDKSPTDVKKTLVEEASANKEPSANEEPSSANIKPIEKVDNTTAPEEKTTENTAPKEVAITDNVTITATDTNKINKEISNANKPKEATNGSIKIIAKNSSDSSPIKSNFYIQTLSGKHIAKKTYADSAKFELKAGTYKVTVRANKRKDLVKTLEIRPNNVLTSTFLLEKSRPKTTQENTSKEPRGETPRQERQTNNNSGTGFLRINMRPSGNMRANDKRLNSHFVVYKKSGEKIVELTNVPRANFKLDVGEYKVTAVNNNSQKSQTIQVRATQVTNISFNLTDFHRTTRETPPPPRQAPSQQHPQQPQKNIVLKGGLRSHIVNQAGQHLKGNLTVRNNVGRIVARANNVSVGVFNLPPATYTIVLEYRGLRGSEKVNIITGETTVQTFTLAQ